MTPRSPEEILASLDSVLGKPISGLNDNIGSTPAPSLFGPGASATPAPPSTNLWDTINNGADSLFKKIDSNPFGHGALSTLGFLGNMIEKPFQAAGDTLVYPFQQTKDMINNATNQGLSHTFDSWGQNGQNWMDDMAKLFTQVETPNVSGNALDKYLGTDSSNWYSPGKFFSAGVDVAGGPALGALAKAGKATGGLGLGAARGAADIPGFENMGPEYRYNNPAGPEMPPTQGPSAPWYPLAQDAQDISMGADIGKNPFLDSVPDLGNVAHMPSFPTDAELTQATQLSRPSNVNFPQFTPKKWTPTGSDAASQELEKLLQLAQENGVPAGREYEYLQGLYPTIAGREGVSFDELLNQIKNPLDALEAKKANVYGVPSTEAVKGLLNYRQPFNELDSILGSSAGDMPDILKATGEGLPTNGSMQDLLSLVRNGTEATKEEYAQAIKMLKASTGLDENTLRTMGDHAYMNRNVSQHLQFPEDLLKDTAQTERPPITPTNTEAAATSSSNVAGDLGSILNKPDIAKAADDIFGAKPKVESAKNVDVPSPISSSIEKYDWLKTNRPDLYKENMTPRQLNDVLDKLRNDTPKKPTGSGQGKIESVNNNAAKPFDEFVNEANVEKLPTHEFDPTPLKDISAFNARWNDFYRNTAKVFAKAPSALKVITEKYLNPFNDAKKANFVEQKEITDRLKKEVVDQGIKKGSKESALVQEFGEGRMTLEELKKASPDKYIQISKAEQFFRKMYEDLVDRQNAVLAQAYPNDQSKLIKKRNDYFHHFNELHDMFKGATNLFESPGAAQALATNPSKLKRKAQEFMNTRNGKKFTDDAVGGFLKYLPGATYTIHITPQISKFHELAQALESQTRIGGTPKVQNYIRSLRELSADLAGEPNPIDKVAKGVVPEKVFEAASYINNRVKTNMVLGSISSAVGQTLNIPNGIAFVKNPMQLTKGLEMTVKQFKNENAPIRKSGFISERYGRELYRQFDTRWWEQPKRGAEFMLEAVDKMGTSFIWNSVYAKGIAEGVENPIRYADAVTHRMVAGRGVGEVPLGQKSQLIQMMIPFTLEVGNAMKVTGEFAKHDRTALAVLLATNFVANMALEHIRGFGGGFDPIGAGVDAYGDLKDGKPLEAAGRMAGEFLSNIPSGQFIGSLYPQDGSIAGMNLPSRKQIFGKSDPTRFGTGPAFAEAIKNPLLAVLPFGANQAKKTAGGYNAIQDGGTFTKGGNEVMFPTDRNNMAQDLQMLAFGPYSTSNARNYFDQNNRPLSELQTKQFKNSNDKQALYDNIQRQRDIEQKQKEAKKKAKGAK